MLNRVIRLTPTQFEEEPASVIEPDTNGPYPDGLHTIAAVGDITILDGRRFGFVQSAFKRALLRGLSRAGVHTRDTEPDSGSSRNQPLTHSK